MKKLVIISLFASIIFAQQRSSYSWEDGTGTILGYDGNLVNPENVGTTSGISPHNGSRMLTVSESPIQDGHTPKAYVAFIENLSPGDVVTASFYGWDENTNGSPSLRIWGLYTSNGNINDNQGSAGGNNTYTSCNNCWDQLEHTWTIASGKEALAIEARLYSGDDDPTIYFIDQIEITAPSSATINYPGTASGCTNTSACNYNPFATEDDGSCVYPEGSISIYDIQYTDDQGEYCYESIHDQECWTTTGTVTAVSPENNSFYIQDFNSIEYTGIHVHDMSPIPTLGQNITLTAIVNEYYSNTQLLNGSTFSVNSSGNSIEPTDITTGDLANGCSETGESLEGMLVRISDISVTVPSNEFGEWSVSDGSGNVIITKKTGCQDYGEEIFDGAETDWPTPSSGQEYDSIVGVVDYAYSEFRILPRNLSDITLCPTCPVADAGEDQFVTPESIVTLDGSNSFDPNGNIIFVEWTQTSGSPVSLSDDEAFITTFTSPSTNDDLIFKITIYDNDYNEASDEVTITVGLGTSIHDIQCPDDLVQGSYCYETSMSGNEISTYGIVSHVLPIGHSSEGNFFFQWGQGDCSGIYVRDFDIVPNVGDELTLTGTVNEYYSFTQIIDVSSSSISSTQNSTVPISISTNDLGIDCSQNGEHLESMLVKVSNVQVEGIDEFGNIQINDGSGPTLIDDYYFDGNWPNISIGDTFPNIIGVVGYSYSEFKIYPRNENDLMEIDECFGYVLGDLNSDTAFNVLDIVALANCILANNCQGSLSTKCAGDLNLDGMYNVLDIVGLANCVLASNCGN